MAEETFLSADSAPAEPAQLKDREPAQPASKKLFRSPLPAPPAGGMGRLQAGRGAALSGGGGPWPMIFVMAMPGARACLGAGRT